MNTGSQLETGSLPFDPMVVHMEINVVSGSDHHYSNAAISSQLPLFFPHVVSNMEVNVVTCEV